MRRRKWVLILVILFIGINIGLVSFDRDGKVERKSYIKDWSKVFTADMFVTLDKPGVLASIQENNIYFDKSMGTFKEFLVDEGTKVQAGDKLYTYQVVDYAETKARLENEIDVINGKILAVEGAISKVSLYQNAQVKMVYKSNDKSQETTVPPVEADYLKQQYLAEKENELAQETARLQSVQAQLAALEARGNTIAVASPFEGRVTLVSKSLQDPLITIESTDLLVKGQLTEQERQDVENGMPVKVIVSNGVLSGEVSLIGNSPKAVSVSKPSIYPFQVTFSDEADVADLLPGYHADMVITLKESQNAVVAADRAFFAKHIWKMTDEGKLTKQKIEAGIHMGEKQQIVDGAKAGDWLAMVEHSQFRSGATFVTPLKWSEIQWKQLADADFNWQKHFVTGLLAR